MRVYIFSCLNPRFLNVFIVEGSNKIRTYDTHKYLKHLYIFYAVDFDFVLKHSGGTFLRFDQIISRITTWNLLRLFIEHTPNRLVMSPHNLNEIVILVCSKGKHPSITISNCSISFLLLFSKNGKIIYKQFIWKPIRGRTLCSTIIRIQSKTFHCTTMSWNCQTQRKNLKENKSAHWFS